MAITLSTYEVAVRQLMQPAWSGIIPTVTLDSYINTARSQLAMDAECIRDIVFQALTTNVIQYAFRTMGPLTSTGFLQPIAVRQLQISGAGWPIEMRPWEWYWAYDRIKAPVTGQPTVAVQLDQGVSGVLFLFPTPNQAYTLEIDAVMLPADLLPDNSIPETIPYPWTDAVAFYAAWLAFQQVQRQADAQLMLARYKELALRGREGVTPTVLPENYQGGAGAQIAASRTTVMMRPQQPALGG